jgi:hypothetical protein
MLTAKMTELGQQGRIGERAMRAFSVCHPAGERA